MRHAWAVLAAALTLACVRTSFTPYSARQGRLSELTGRAVQIYQGDLATLAAADARPIGTLEATAGTVVGKQKIIERSAQDAASHGATHMILGTLGTRETRVAPAYAYTYCSSGTCWTTINPGTQVSRNAAFLLLRVERESWNKLPAALLPPGRTSRL